MTTEGTEIGRIITGTKYHCAHGDQTVIQTVVDWNPFNYMTLDVAFAKDQRFRITTKLTPIDQLTNVTWYFSMLGGDNFIDTFLTKRKTSKMKGLLSDLFNNGGMLLREMLQDDITEGKISN